MARGQAISIDEKIKKAQDNWSLSGTFLGS